MSILLDIESFITTANVLFSLRAIYHKRFYLAFVRFKYNYGRMKEDRTMVNV